MIYDMQPLFIRTFIKKILHIMHEFDDMHTQTLINFSPSIFINTNMRISQVIKDISYY